jgi:hypothetical protein
VTAYTDTAVTIYLMAIPVGIAIGVGMALWRRP